MPANFLMHSLLAATPEQGGNINELGVTLGVGIAAVLYSSVGHGGASGYLAVMALLGVAPGSMKSTALALNIIVSSIATFRFAWAGAFSGALFWPFAITSVPFAFLGGLAKIPSDFYQPLLGVVLLYACWHTMRQATSTESDSEPSPSPPPLSVALPVGAGIGLLSGMTGVGGGIFLSPLLLINRWAGPRRIAAAAAPFILVNSVAAFSGMLSSGTPLPNRVWLWVASAGLGGAVGAELGSSHLRPSGILYILAFVLAVAGLKLFLTPWL